MSSSKEEGGYAQFQIKLPAVRRMQPTAIGPDFFQLPMSAYIVNENKMLIAHPRRP